MRAEDLTDKVFGELKVISKAGVTKSKKTLWKCKCLLCGEITYVVTGHLKSGHTTTCGCTKIKHNHSHGKDRRLYSIWVDMRRRCNNPDNECYSYYGERGIKVCEEWDCDFIPFMKWSYEHGYSKDLTIDRIDNYKGYSPDNCRWVTRADNNRNKRKHQDERDSLE